MKYRKLPVVIEAFQFTESGKYIHYPEWFNAALARDVVKMYADHLLIETLEGTHKAGLGDWIIQGVKGELYPCKSEIFEMTYEAMP